MYYTQRNTLCAQEKNMKKYSFIRNNNNNNNNEEKYHKIKLINVLDYYYYMDEIFYGWFYFSCLFFFLCVFRSFYLRFFLSFYFCNVYFKFSNHIFIDNVCHRNLFITTKILIYVNLSDGKEYFPVFLLSFRFSCYWIVFKKKIYACLKEYLFLYML